MCAEVKLSINESKCKLLRFSRIPNVLFNNYELNGTKIECVTQFRDLGVVMDSHLSFVPHIDYICSHAAKMLSFIIRNTRGFKNIESLKILHYAYVRSKLEYCSVVWDPHYNIHIMCLERIQRRFCKFLYMVRHGAYPVRHYRNADLLCEMNLNSLKVRRILACNVFLYKVLHGSVDSSDLLSRIDFRVPRQNSRCAITFNIRVCRTNQHYFSPLNNMCRNYNTLTLEIDIFRWGILHFVQECKKLLSVYCNF